MFLPKILYNCLFLQRKYIIKFSTDGAVLTTKKSAVQGTIRIFDVNNEWKPMKHSTLPKHFQQELPIYYYLGCSIIAIEIHKKLMNRKSIYEHF